jgi:DNA-binding response OmpR family regulator
MRILVAEPDESVSVSLMELLRTDSYKVDIASTGEDAVQMAKAVDYDLIIMALRFPRLNGLEVLKRLRALKKLLPVLVVTKINSTENRVAALDLGADDYMTRPFVIRELLARIRALLRRTSALHDLTLRVADLEVDRVARTVKRDRRKIELTPKEFALLEYLIRNTGKHLTRSMILRDIWGRPSDSASTVVEVYINYLRKKVDSGFKRKLIRTVRGGGYQIGDPDWAGPMPHGQSAPYSEWVSGRHPRSNMH